MRRPTLQEVRRYAERWSLEPAGDQLELLQDAVAESLARADEVAELQTTAQSVRQPDRDPGRPATPGEDPLRAFIRFCEIRGAPSGRLQGRTVAVKDCIAVAGVPLTNGGRRTPVAVPSEDAVVVERLLQAGAVIKGKTNMDDLAMGLGQSSGFGSPRNPVDPRFSTGGSSSGSAAAVASGMVDMALGADQAGSVRIPAAWCGIVGMKATHGLVPSYGLSYADHTLDHIGPMTKSVYDNALMLEVIAGADARDPQWVRSNPNPGAYLGCIHDGVRDVRIGVVDEATAPVGCAPDVLVAFDTGLDRLAAAGAHIIRGVSIPLWLQTVSIQMTLVTLALYGMNRTFGIGFGHLGRVNPHAVAAWAAQLTQHADDVPLMLKAALVTAEYVLDRYHGAPFVHAQNARLDLRAQISRALADVDLLVTPTTPHVAQRLPDATAGGDEEARSLNSMAAIANTAPLNMSGHPALTVPCGTGQHSLPVGLQIIGPHFAEGLCYSAAFALEASTT